MGTLLLGDEYQTINTRIVSDSLDSQVWGTPESRWPRIETSRPPGASVRIIWQYFVCDQQGPAMEQTVDLFPMGSDALEAFQSAKRVKGFISEEIGAGSHSFQDSHLSATFLQPNMVVSVKVAAAKFGGVVTFAQLLDRQIPKLEQTISLAVVATRLTPNVELAGLRAYRSAGIPSRGIPAHPALSVSVRFDLGVPVTVSEITLSSDLATKTWSVNLNYTGRGTGSALFPADDFNFGDREIIVTLRGETQQRDWQFEGKLLLTGSFDEPWP